MTKKNKEINEIFNCINNYIINRAEIPYELLFKLRETINYSNNENKELADALDLNNKYQLVITELIDYINRQLNTRAEHKTYYKSVMLRKDFSEYLEPQEVKFQEVYIPAVTLVFMENSEHPIIKRM